MTILVKPFDVLQFVDVKISTGQFWVICSEFVEVLAICLETGQFEKFAVARIKLPFLPLYRKRTFRFSFNLLLHSFEQLKYGWNDQLQLPCCFCRQEGNLPMLLHEAFGGDGASASAPLLTILIMPMCTNVQLVEQDLQNSAVFLFCLGRYPKCWSQGRHFWSIG